MLNWSIRKNERNAVFISLCLCVTKPVLVEADVAKLANEKDVGADDAAEDVVSEEEAALENKQ